MNRGVPSLRLRATLHHIHETTRQPGTHNSPGRRDPGFVAASSLAPTGRSLLVLRRRSLALQREPAATDGEGWPGAYDLRRAATKRAVAPRRYAVLGRLRPASVRHLRSGSGSARAKQGSPPTWDPKSPGRRDPHQFVNTNSHPPQQALNSACPERPAQGRVRHRDRTPKAAWGRPGPGRTPGA